MVEAMTLVERLRDAWRAHYGSSLNHGCVDCGLSANLCDEAADRIEQMARQIHNLTEQFSAEARKRCEVETSLHSLKAERTSHVGALSLVAAEMSADAYAHGYADGGEDQSKGLFHQDAGAEGYQNWLANKKITLTKENQHDRD